MKKGSDDFWWMLLFTRQAQAKRAREAANPGKKKPRILPIILGMFACQFIAIITVIGNIKSFDVILNVVNILLWILLIRAIVIRGRRK